MSRALIIVDVQRDFLPGGALGVPDGDAVIDRINELARDGEFDVVLATRDWHPEDHASFAAQGGPWPPHCVQGTPGAELSPDLARERIDVVIDKGATREGEGYSGFETGELGTLLRTERVTEVTLTGLATDYCVAATARDALRDIDELCAALIDSGRWERVTAERLDRDVHECGPDEAVAAIA
jgi:nicotinamidase/pyrazinamidase